MQRLSHCFSCGQTRPQTAGRADVSFNTLAAARNWPRSIFLMNDGMLMLTGQPSTQVGFAQSRHRLASVSAISLVSPRLTSSNRVVARYSGSSSGMTTRLMAARSLPLSLLLSSTRHSASRLVSSSIVASVGETSIVMSVSDLYFCCSDCSRCS